MNADQRPDRVKFVTSGEVSDAQPGADGAGLVQARARDLLEPTPAAASSFGLLAVLYVLGCAIGGAALAAWTAFKGPLP